MTISGAAIPSTYAGDRVPDVAANIRHQGSWGQVQLSSALHQISGVAALTTVATLANGSASAFRSTGSEDTRQGRLRVQRDF